MNLKPLQYRIRLKKIDLFSGQSIDFLIGSLTMGKGLAPIRVSPKKSPLVGAVLYTVR